ncbi:UV excision repair protein rad23 [Tritrichomonas musculus]|uniref:UV excision repair protein rad23 n=1 Tax=Tritrichomonas musculus TaxID=1915356 RepID=A0ABR2GY39_9EUKA
MQVKLMNLEGKHFDLTFNEDVTVQSICQKLLKEYNYNTNDCYFFRNNKIFNERIKKESFTTQCLDTLIIIFNSNLYPDKSFPKVDNAFNLNFSRYSENYIKSNINISKKLDSDQSNTLHHLYNLGILPPEIESTIRDNNNLSNDDNSFQSESDDEDREVNDINNQQDSGHQSNIDTSIFREIYIPSFVEDIQIDPPSSREIRDLRLSRIEFMNALRNHVRPTNHSTYFVPEPTAQITLLYNGYDLDNDQPLPPPPQPANQNHVPARIFTAQHGPSRTGQSDLDQQIIESLNMNIELSENDHQIISRLCQSGYDRAMVIQAYEACDRNEDQTMSLLLAL